MEAAYATPLRRRSFHLAVRRPSRGAIRIADPVGFKRMRAEQEAQRIQNKKIRDMAMVLGSDQRPAAPCECVTVC